MSKMKCLFAALLTGLVMNVANAQTEEITDESLRRYALMMEVIDAMKAEISELTKEMIANQEGIDGTRYNELSKAKGDEAKLAEMGANDLEKQFMVLVYEKQEERKDAIKDVLQILATKMMSEGGKTYKSVKTALQSDEEVKERYNDILEDIRMDDDSADS